MRTATTRASQSEADAHAEHPAHQVHQGVPYLRFLRRLYEHCAPRSYLEIQGCSTLWSERGAGGALKEIFSLSEGDLV